MKTKESKILRQRVSQHSSSHCNFYAYRVQSLSKTKLVMLFDKSQIEGLGVPCPLCCVKVTLARPLKHTRWGDCENVNVKMS